MNCERHWQWSGHHINVRIRHLKYCVCCPFWVHRAEMWCVWYEWGLQCSSCPVNNLASFDVTVWSEVALSLHHLWHVNPASILSPYLLLKGQLDLLWLPVYALCCSVSQKMSPTRRATHNALGRMWICVHLLFCSFDNTACLCMTFSSSLNMNFNVGNVLFLKGL